MKKLITLIFLISQISAFCQIPEKEDFFKAYYSGHKFFDAIQLKDTIVTKKIFNDGSKIAELSDIIDELTDELKERIQKDVLFNQETKQFEFVVFYGDYISTNDNWGLMNYKFILLTKIDLTVSEDRVKQIQSSQIFLTEEEQKTWWREYMKSYRDEKYARDKIAKIYGMVPPPPPPPKTKEWHIKYK